MSLSSRVVPISSLTMWPIAYSIMSKRLNSVLHCLHGARKRGQVGKVFLSQHNFRVLFSQGDGAYRAVAEAVEGEWRGFFIEVLEKIV